MLTSTHFSTFCTHKVCKTLPFFINTTIQSEKHFFTCSYFYHLNFPCFYIWRSGLLPAPQNQVNKADFNIWNLNLFTSGTIVLSQRRQSLGEIESIYSSQFPTNFNTFCHIGKTWGHSHIACTLLYLAFPAQVIFH